MDESSGGATMQGGEGSLFAHITLEDFRREGATKVLRGQVCVVVTPGEVWAIPTTLAERLKKLPLR